MGSSCLFLRCMPFILSVFYRISQEAFETTPTGKIVVMYQKLLNITENLNLLKLFVRAIIFKKVISNCSILQRNVSKLDRSKCSFTSFIGKYYNFYYPTFFLLKIYFPFTNYE